MDGKRCIAKKKTRTARRTLEPLYQQQLEFKVDYTGKTLQVVCYSNLVTCVSIAINPLRPNSDLSQTSHCNIKGVSVSEVMRIENMITQVKFY